MKIADIGCYISKLFENGVLVVISAIGTFLYNVFFPELQYLYGTLAVLAVMILDLLTKLFMLYRKSGRSWKKAFKSKAINSSKFSKGTIDKLVVFGVMMIICAAAYRLTIISAIALWFTQLVYTLMFLRDVLSILENLSDAGIDVKIFKKVVKKKLDNYCAEQTNDENL